jgi:hypothetical protein
MKKLYKILLQFLVLSSPTLLLAQPTTLSSTGVFLNNNGSGMVTLNFTNNNSFPVRITTIEGVTGTAGANTAFLYFKPGAISGNPGAISPANGWDLAASEPFTGIANTTTTTTQVFINNANLIIPANTTYGLVVFANWQRYFTYSLGVPTNITGGGCVMGHGVGISFGNGTPPAAPGIADRAWIGSITFEPVGPPPHPSPHWPISISL